ncbi:hypothetical protein G5V58_24325 [Nocardioides anomalus]|uniref:Matrixin family metalloprotease n=1 Tax=Nocardioides anomalus TaxID=2712223 RepID=A0A6G6WJE8_9ACTN|nr:hypothetical protein [Nocardioides anomalus]QIG45458.1 hypothetical protein G5V58_24325 [Nocardioides anomalus]
MTSSSPRRALAASLVLGVSGALLSAVGPSAVAADPQSSSASTVAAKPHHGGKGHHKHKGKVTWDVTSVTAGTGAVVAAHGKVPGRKVKVKLQVKAGKKWISFGKTKSDKKGKFAISGALDWYGVHKVRVSTSGRKAFHKGTKVSVATPYAPRGNPADHAFTLSSQGQRYSFNPCKTIRYVVNADDVGPTGIALAQAGMEQMSMATGIDVKYVGTSHTIATADGRWPKLPKGQDFLISWATEAEVPEFVTTPAIGFGGPRLVYYGRDAHGKHVGLTTQAGIVLDTDAYFSGVYDQSYLGTKPAWGETILHEIGHAMGLAHFEATDEIMYPGAGRGVYPDGYFRGLYGAGDLAGLATNGLDQGCITKASRPRVSARMATPRMQY